MSIERGHEAILERLVAQAERGDAGGRMTLRALVEEASEAGATRALGALGLDDAHARRDMDELRLLLSAWRDAKTSARRAVVEWIVRLGMVALLIGMAIKLKLTDLVVR